MRSRTLSLVAISSCLLTGGFFGNPAYTQVSGKSPIKFSKSSDPTGTVIGYIWEARPGSPLFESLSLAPVGDNFEKPFKIYLWDGKAFKFYKELLPMAKLQFPPGGASKIKIEISPDLEVCATDSLVTSFAFTREGNAEISKEVITNNIRNPDCALAQSKDQPNQAPASRPPSGFLVPDSATIPAGYKESFHTYRHTGYNVQWNDLKDLNRNGNPASLMISEHFRTREENYDSTLKHLALTSRKLMGKVDYNGLHGVIFKTMESPGSYEHILVLKDGDRVLSIQSHDGAKRHFTMDDLIGILKTLKRQK